MSESLILPLLIFLAAILYSSVGHAGASGYLAAMALVGLAPAEMKPTALLLNILVASIASVQFARAGCFSWKLFWPFAVTSLPLAYIGGAATLPGTSYKIIVGLVLFYSAARMIMSLPPVDSQASARFFRMTALPAGAAIGFLSGLLGVGGGIFLSPLLLLAGWADVRRTAGVSAAFILANSLAGMAGHFAATQSLPKAAPILALAAITGGLLGSTYGSRRLNSTVLRRLLAIVLLTAGLKMLFT